MTAEDYISIDITAETGQLLYWNTEHDDPESYDVTPAPRVVNSKMAQAALGYVINSAHADILAQMMAIVADIKQLSKIMPNNQQCSIKNIHNFNFSIL